MQDRVAEAFGLPCKDQLTAHVPASLTLSALSLTYCVWCSQGKKDIGAAAGRVFAEFKNATSESDLPCWPGDAAGWLSRVGIEYIGGG